VIIGIENFDSILVLQGNKRYVGFLISSHKVEKFNGIVNVRFKSISIYVKSEFKQKLSTVIGHFDIEDKHTTKYIELTDAYQSIKILPCKCVLFEKIMPTKEYQILY
jgi:hypothetical protein